MVDCIVLGTGGVGSAALFHIARRGAKAMGLDRFSPGHDRGSSHGETRLIRQAYFEHPDYVPLLLRAYELWGELSKLSGKDLYHETGLLEVGPPEGILVRGVLSSAKAHRLEVEEVPPAAAESRFKGLRVPPSMLALHERRAGYLRVEECVLAHVEEAQKLGAMVRTGETVLEWAVDGDGVRVRTDQGSYQAARLIITAGPWAGDLLDDLGLPLEVRRKPVFWYQAAGIEYQEKAGCPAFLYETPAGFFYGFPATKTGAGLKVAEHTGGEVVSDPLHIDRSLRPADRAPVERFLDQYLPGVTRECLKHSVCMYTMTPDEHFVVGLYPGHSRVALAAGLSGHGFKFTGVLGEALSDLVLEGKTSLPIGFLSPERLLHPRPSG
jgi:monomeric sarcosine oxidase